MAIILYNAIDPRKSEQNASYQGAPIELQVQTPTATIVHLQTAPYPQDLLQKPHVLVH